MRVYVRVAEMHTGIGIDEVATKVVRILGELGANVSYDRWSRNWHVLYHTAAVRERYAYLIEVEWGLTAAKGLVRVWKGTEDPKLDLGHIGTPEEVVTDAFWMMEAL